MLYCTFFFSGNIESTPSNIGKKKTSPIALSSFRVCCNFATFGRLFSEKSQPSNSNPVFSSADPFFFGCSTTGGSSWKRIGSASQTANFLGELERSEWDRSKRVGFFFRVSWDDETAKFCWGRRSGRLVSHEFFVVEWYRVCYMSCPFLFQEL